MDKPMIVDKRASKLEEVTKADFIPFLGGRPKRTTIISKDEITNLAILLYTTSTVAEFLTKI